MWWFGTRYFIKHKNYFFNLIKNGLLTEYEDYDFNSVNVLANVFRRWKKWKRSKKEDNKKNRCEKVGEKKTDRR